jgi:hypothetical protein
MPESLGRRDLNYYTKPPFRQFSIMMDRRKHSVAADMGFSGDRRPRKPIKPFETNIPIMNLTLPPVSTSKSDGTFRAHGHWHLKVREVQANRLSFANVLVLRTKIKVVCNV